MGTKYPEIFAALAAEFPKGEIHSRKGGGGSTLWYITARQAMNRLDEVLGPENWEDKYDETREGLKCRLSVRLPDGEWLTKEDGGAAAAMSEADNNEKSAFSDAFKRAAVKFGVGRYLYRDGIPNFENNGNGEPSQLGTNGSPSPRPEPGPSSSATSEAHEDKRTYWELVTDATNKRNDPGHGTIDTHWMLVVLAVCDGKMSKLPVIRGVADSVPMMNTVFVRDRRWVISTLKSYVQGNLTPRRVDSHIEGEPFSGAWLERETNAKGRGVHLEATRHLIKALHASRLEGLDLHFDPATIDEGSANLTLSNACSTNAAARRVVSDAMLDYLDAHPCSLMPLGAENIDTTDSQPQSQPQHDSGGGYEQPRTGKALFAWTKEQEEKYGVALLKYINVWAKLQDFSGRMVDWNDDQVGLAYCEMMRKLNAIISDPDYAGTPDN